MLLFYSHPQYKYKKCIFVVIYPSRKNITMVMITIPAFFIRLFAASFIFQFPAFHHPNADITMITDNGADKIVGIYYVIEPDSKEESKVEIYKTASGKYEGKVIWLKEPRFPDGSYKTDIKNPDPNMRKVRGDQIVLLKNFTYNAKKEEWSGGEIYNPVEGKTYKAFMKFESPTKLKVRGYIGVSALGRSMYWTKIS